MPSAVVAANPFVVYRLNSNLTLTNTAVLTDVGNGMEFDVGAGETWHFLWVIHTDTGVDWWPAVVGPAGSTILANRNGINSGSTNYLGGEPVAGGVAISNCEGGNGTKVHQIQGSIRNGATAGVCKLQWKQDGSSGTAAKMQIGTHFFAAKVGG